MAGGLPLAQAGQIELYTHIPVMPAIVALLQREGFNVCGVYLVRVNGAPPYVLVPTSDAACGATNPRQLDAMFVSDVSKLLSGTLMALSAMMHLELPHVNVRHVPVRCWQPVAGCALTMYPALFAAQVLSKCDLVDVASIERYGAPCCRGGYLPSVLPPTCD